MDVFQQSFFTCGVKVCEPLFSSCISFSRLSIDGSKPTVQEDILYPTGSPKLSSRYSQNKTQCMGIKARPQLLLHPLGSINEPSYSCVQWPKHHKQDQQWCTSKNIQTYQFWIRCWISMQWTTWQKKFLYMDHQPIKQEVLGKYVESFECLLGKILFQRKQHFSGGSILRLISICAVSHQLEGSFSDKSLI